MKITVLMGDGCHDHCHESVTIYKNTVFPQLDALHVLDASAHFDAGWSGRNTF